MCRDRSTHAALEKKVYTHSVNVLESNRVQKANVWIMFLFRVYIWLMVILKLKKEVTYVD